MTVSVYDLAKIGPSPTAALLLDTSSSGAVNIFPGPEPLPQPTYAVLFSCVLSCRLSAMQHAGLCCNALACYALACYALAWSLCTWLVMHVSHAD